MKTASIDINCDMGEDIPGEEALFPFISSANVACGYHAGSEQTMHRTVQLAAEHQVAIGAHPGFDDRAHFGRRAWKLPEPEYYALVMKQLERLHRVCSANGLRLHHVKPHGALYHMAASERLVAEAIAKAVKDFDAGLCMLAPPGSALLAAAQHHGLRIAAEAFADRRYLNDGTLQPRSEPGSVIHSEEDCVQQALHLVTRHAVTTVSGQTILLHAHSICVHSDTPQAATLARAIYQTLTEHGINIKPFA